MKPAANIDITELVRILTALFPNQHKLAAAWLLSLHSKDAVAGTRTVPPVKASQNPPPPRNERPQSVAQLTRKPYPPNPATHQSASGGKTAPEPPSFARRWIGTVNDWATRQQGNDITFDEVQRRVEAVIRASGLTGWEQGFVLDLICLAADVKLGGYRPDPVRIEIFIPRSETNSLLLVAIRQDGLQHFFEMSIAALQPGRLEQLRQCAYSIGIMDKSSKRAADRSSERGFGGARGDRRY